jgi:hypothetical protein
MRPGRECNGGLPGERAISDRVHDPILAIRPPAGFQLIEAGVAGEIPACAGMASLIRPYRA